MNPVAWLINFRFQGTHGGASPGWLSAMVEAKCCVWTKKWLRSHRPCSCSQRSGTKMITLKQEVLTSAGNLQETFPDLWGPLEIYCCKSLQIKCIGTLVVQRTRPNMVGQKKQSWSVPERLSRPLYDLGNLAWQGSRNTMASKTNLCWSVPERLSRPLYDLGNLAWQRSRNTMASKTNLCWSVPERLSRPLYDLGNLAWQRSRATMASKTNLCWSVPETLSRPL